MAAIVADSAAPSSPGPIDETVWNDYSLAEIAEKGRDAEPMDKYRASKTLTRTSGPTTRPKAIDDVGASFASALYTIADGSHMRPASWESVWLWRDVDHQRRRTVSGEGVRQYM